MSDTPRNDAAMADILASIRRIVADEDRRGGQATAFDGDVLELTQEMRVDGGVAPPPRRVVDPMGWGGQSPRAAVPPAPARPAPSPDAAAMLAGAPDTAPDEAAVADIVRAVLREEFAGALGRSLSTQVRQLVQAEVTRALAARDQAKG